MAENRLIFLGGCPRSGTTLVQNMLDSHPDVAGGPEFLHLVDIVRLRSMLLTSVAKGWIDLFCSAEDVDRHFRNLIEQLLLPFADRRGGKILSEKSPENILAMSGLVELFPDAKFVCIVRDPRAIIASLLATGQRARAKGEQPAAHTVDLASAMRFTERCLKAGFEVAAARPHQVYTLQYEKLVTEPEAESRRLCEFLAIPWSADMLRPAEKEHAGEAAITVNSKEIWYDKATYYSNPDPGKIEKWREELAPYQQILISRTFARWKELRQLGYDLSCSTMDARSRMIASRIADLSRIRSGLMSRFRKLIVQ